nr:hypothetical protein CFP56_77964 [Quercus suber]
MDVIKTFRFVVADRNSSPRFSGLSFFGTIHDRRAIKGLLMKSEDGETAKRRGGQHHRRSDISYLSVHISLPGKYNKTRKHFTVADDPDAYATIHPEPLLPTPRLWLQGLQVEGGKRLTPRLLTSRGE